MWLLFRVGILCGLAFWAYLFFVTPVNLTDLAQRIGQLLPKPQQVSAAVAGARPQAGVTQDRARPASTEQQNPAPAPEPAGDRAGRHNRIRVH